MRTNFNLASPTRNRNGLIAAGAVLALLGTTSCDSSAQRSPDVASTSAEAHTGSNISARNYCTDNPSDRGLPLRVEDGKLVVGVHGECAGDPNAPVGIYAEPTQANRSVTAVPNGTEFAAECTEEGQDIRTDAAALSNPGGITSSKTWLRGSLPANEGLGGELYIPHAMTGFTVLQLGKFQLKACT